MQQHTGVGGIAWLALAGFLFAATLIINGLRRDIAGTRWRGVLVVPVVIGSASLLVVTVAFVDHLIAIPLNLHRPAALAMLAALSVVAISIVDVAFLRLVPVIHSILRTQLHWPVSRALDAAMLIVFGLAMTGGITALAFAARGLSNAGQ